VILSDTLQSTRGLAHLSTGHALSRQIDWRSMHVDCGRPRTLGEAP